MPGEHPDERGCPHSRERHDGEEAAVGGATRPTGRFGGTRTSSVPRGRTSGYSPSSIRRATVAMVRAVPEPRRPGRGWRWRTR